MQPNLGDWLILKCLVVNECRIIIHRFFESLKPGLKL